MLLIGPLASATMFKKLILPYFVLNFKVVGIPYMLLKYRKSPRVAQHTTNWPQHQCYGYRPTGLAQVIWRKNFFDKLLRFNLTIAYFICFEIFSFWLPSITAQRFLCIKSWNFYPLWFFVMFLLGIKWLNFGPLHWKT